MRPGVDEHDHDDKDRQHGRGRDMPLPDDVRLAFDDAGGEYLYRPGQLLVAAGEADEVRRTLDDQRLLGKGVGDEYRDESLGLVTFRLDEDTDIPDLVDRVRQAGSGRLLQVGPNHVVSFSSHVHWAPGAAPPRPGKPLVDISTKASLPGEGVRVGVVDTGADAHPWFDGRVVAEPGDEDPADNDGDGALDREAGHGTFVAGVVLRYAPGATVIVKRSHSKDGLTDELALARAMVELAAVDVLNLSLGCYGHGDHPPVALLSGLQRVWESNPDVVVVAAAGNDGWDRPFWPAALKRVIGVAALDDHGQRAPFSNHGWWVDASAPAVDVQSTFLDWDGPTATGEDATFRRWATWSGTSFAAPRVAGAIAARASQAAADVPGAAHSVVGARGLPRMTGLGVVLDGAPPG